MMIIKMTKQWRRYFGLNRRETHCLLKNLSFQDFKNQFYAHFLFFGLLFQNFKMPHDFWNWSMFWVDFLSGSLSLWNYGFRGYFCLIVFFLRECDNHGQNIIKQGWLISHFITTSDYISCFYIRVAHITHTWAPTWIISCGCSKECTSLSP